jgi:hypothetical protein
MSETNTDNRGMMDAARAASTGKSSLTGYARLVFFMLRKMRGPVLQVQLRLAQPRYCAPALLF